MPLSLNSATAAKPDDPTADNPAFATPSGEALLVGGDINTWKWQPAVTTTATSFSNMEMYSAFGAKLDSAVTLVGTAAIADGVQVGAAKYALGNKATAFTNQVWLAPFEAGSVVLTADDLNSMLWTQKYNAAASKVKFTFDKDVAKNTLENLFSKNSYKAVPAIGFPAAAPANTGTLAAAGAVAALDTKQAAVVAAINENALAQAIKTAIDDDIATNAPVALSAAQALANVATASGTDTPAKLNLLFDAIDLSTGTAAEQAIKSAVRDALKAFVLTCTISSQGEADAVVAKTVNTGGSATGIVNKIATPTTVTAQNTALKEYTDAITKAREEYKTQYATSYEAFTTAGGGAYDNNWLSLEYTKAEGNTPATYLAVDTAYLTGNVGSSHLAFAIKKFEEVGGLKHLNMASDNVTAQDLNGRFNFQFTYYPSSDSLVIRTGGFAVKNGDAAYWTDMTTTTNPDDLGMDKAKIQKAQGAINGPSDLEKEMNVIKIVGLGTDGRREVTVGSSEYLGQTFSPKSTINTRIYIGRTTSDDRTTLASGLYFINLKSGLAARASENNGYKVAKLTANQYGASSTAVKYAAEDESQLLGTIQNFYNMPATQWVVEQGVGETGKELVSIYNREYPSIKVENIQLYKDANGNIAMPFAAGNYFSAADTLAFGIIKPTDSETYTNEYLGYAQIDSTILDEKIFRFDYLSGIQMGNYVNVLDSKTDSVLRVDLKGANTMFVLETAPVKAEGYFGYAGKLALGKDRMFQHLRRTAYVLKVQDGDKLIQNNKYVKMVSTTSTGEPLYVVADIKKADAAQFFLKENNEVTVEKKATPYYALVGAQVIANDTLYQETTDRVGVKDGSLLLSNEKYNETRVAAFALTEDNSPLYRRLGVSDPTDGLKNMTTDTAKIYRINATAREYLYEDAYSAYSKEKGINFLGVEGKGDAKAASLFVDTAYVRNETNMPQYMFAVGVTVVPEGMMCPENPEHNTPEYIANHGDCGHKVQTKGYVYGRYLINAQDSVVSAPNGKDYIWNEKYTRLAFVPAKHIEDTLVIYRNGKPSLAPEDSIFLGNNAHNKVTDERPNGIKNPVFALRLINDEPQCDFLIESAGNHKIPTENTGKWIAIKNGVPVVASYLTYKDAILDAEHFNIEKTTEVPTANEGISTSEVSVIAGNGTVTIKGAQGKTVVIANVLGQTIANTVLSSDNAEIAAPAGVVVVAVEGEAAVKAIVK